MTPRRAAHHSHDRRDFNRDGHVDQNDLVLFAGLRDGLTISLTPGCEVKDLDGDGDVDQSDFGRFKGA